jgi:hypothetical protein
MRLQSATPTVMNLTFQAGPMGYDLANPSEAAVAGFGSAFICWFNPVTMTFLRNFSIDSSYTLAVYNNQTFTATNAISSIFIRDSQSNNRLGNITYSSLASVRKIIFINNGQTAVVSTQNNQSLTLFNVNSPTNYTIQVNKLITISSKINQRCFFFLSKKFQFQCQRFMVLRKLMIPFYTHHHGLHELSLHLNLKIQHGQAIYLLTIPSLVPVLMYQ